MNHIDQTAVYRFLRKMNALNWGLWPPESEWPDLGVGYTLFQHGYSQTQTCTTIKFNTPTTIGKNTSRRFSVGPRCLIPASSIRLTPLP